MAQTSINRKQEIARREEAIITHVNDLLQETLGQHLAREGYEIDHIVELQDIRILTDIFSGNDTEQFITETSMECLGKLAEEINALIKVMEGYDEELTKLLLNIGDIVKDLINGHDIPKRKEDNIIERRRPRGDMGSRDQIEGQSFDSSTETTKKCLEHYGATFVKTIEDFFEVIRKYLDNDYDDEDNLSPTVLKLVNFLLQIPRLKGVGYLVQAVAIYFDKRHIKEIVLAVPPEIIDGYSHSNARIKLIKAAYTIFSHYEYQFSRLRKRFGEKLAIDSASRYLNYLLENANVTEIKSDDIIKGVLLGKSPINARRLFRRGRELIIDRKVISTGDFFTKPAISEETENGVKYYVSKDTLFHLRYRSKFSWDDLSVYETVTYTDSYEYRYTREREKDEVEALCRYIDPDFPYHDSEEEDEIEEENIL